MKKYIDIESWPRKAQYKLFKQMDYPHFNICANLDITKTYSYIKNNEIPFFKAMVFLTSKVVNNIPEFRYRIQGEKIAEYNITHPSFTIMTKPEVFSFCTVDYTGDFHCFNNKVEEKKVLLNGNVDVEDEPNRDDLIFITSIPWISFTSVTHPIHLSPTDSIPRISWGKFFKDNGELKLPFSVQVNHALMDGFHVGKYFEELQEALNKPGESL
ncbi:chloramphenicol acetyltransferase [Geosporobacter ferrireducens]|uniref:Chloramphenicol acetyltransferase n=1 Tax=Geosporobacter ferrireducens TaxID=1424294 RepID=A0A1D8GI01_9FIRM|nr:chloramphenicol acetyltransferase [Geosporobacter ferrireducens]AOT70553.1 chloramphenicol acetyltransferase [Geosporobacter ferrireducens]MTI57086.1 chloramphenicol acetyltransferase [Geosporobacter ferrireducens]